MAVATALTDWDLLSDPPNPVDTRADVVTDCMNICLENVISHAVKKVYANSKPRFTTHRHSHIKEQRRALRENNLCTARGTQLNDCTFATTWQEGGRVCLVSSSVKRVCTPPRRPLFLRTVVSSLSAYNACREQTT